MEEDVPEPSLQDIIASASQKLNYPGADKLYDWLRKHGHVVTKSQVKQFTDRQAVRQVFHQPVKVSASNRGKIVSTSLNARWMADLIDLTAQPSGGGSGNGEGTSSGSKDSPQRPFQYILVVQNLFSRELYARPLRSKDPETVTEAFNSILSKAPSKPGRIDTDNGAEFQGPFDAMLTREGIDHIFKDVQDPNALGTIDRAIQLMKRAIFRKVVAERDPDWAAALPETIAGMNDTVHSKLQGHTPEQVKDDDTPASKAVRLHIG
jgi:hypothetical protein